MDTDCDISEFLPGAPYPRMDRERHRRKKVDFWQGLNGMGEGIALMVEWERMFGASVDLIKPYLKLTGGAKEHIACPGSSDCGCMHYVSETSRGELVATCQCESDWGCSTYQIEPTDVLLHGLDWHLFGDAIRRALGFGAPTGAPYASRGLREIGTYAGVAAPVYLSLAEGQALLRELIKLQGLREGPFMVLTPTGSTWKDDVEGVARPQGGGHISLSSVLVAAGTEFRTVGTAVGPMLEEFGRRVASLRRGGETLVSIHREIAAVRQDYAEVRTAKQRLEKMLAGGMFAFTQKVDVESFKVLCTILAEGDVAKASRSLGVPEETVRAVVRRWEDRGREYKSMADLVRWRKKVGRREKVPLNEAILHERAETVDYPGLLSDVLDGLLSVTEENWEERCQELAELLRPAVRGSSS